VFLPRGAVPQSAAAKAMCVRTGHTNRSMRNAGGLIALAAGLKAVVFASTPVVPCAAAVALRLPRAPASAA
jgi:hypothetical protein